MSDSLSKPRLLLSGGAAGLCCGLFGAGGGMVLLPLLIRFCHMDARRAFASSLAVMLPVSLVSLSVLAMTEGLPLADSVPYLLGGLAGGLLAGVCFRRLPTSLLRRVMALGILWGGWRLLCS